MTHRPRKRFGQNFLQSQDVIYRILHALSAKPQDKIIEIGPGLGALTKPLLHQVDTLTAIEIDRDLYSSLQALPKAAETLTLIEADALTIDYSQWGKHLRILGNLPYNISTPLLLRLLHYSDSIDDMHVMLQKEVAERLAAVPGTKAYGRLSVMFQYRCTVDYLFTVPSEAFYPAPKVESAVVRIVPYLELPYATVDMLDLERVVALSFSMRRKTIINNLKSLLSAEDLNGIGISPKLRPEQLSVRDYVRIVKFLST